MSVEFKKEGEARMRHEIKNGPSKLDLIQSLFLQQQSGKAYRVTFYLEGNLIYAACISSVKDEDGSKEKWIISGSTPSNSCGEKDTVPPRNFRAYYSTAKRRGFMELEDDDDD